MYRGVCVAIDRTSQSYKQRDTVSRIRAVKSHTKLFTQLIAPSSYTCLLFHPQIPHLYPSLANSAIVGLRVQNKHTAAHYNLSSQPARVIELHAENAKFIIIQFTLDTSNVAEVLLGIARPTYECSTHTGQRKQQTNKQQTPSPIVT